MNPKKHPEARRKRPPGGSATLKEVWTEVKVKSNSGVEYSKFRKSITNK